MVSGAIGAIGVVEMGVGDITEAAELAVGDTV